MAKVGNEAKLILRLAKEKMTKRPDLKEEIIRATNPGNYPDQKKPADFIEMGYRTAVEQYESTLSQIIHSLET